MQEVQSPRQLEEGFRREEGYSAWYYNKSYAQLFAETEKLKASCKKLKKALMKK
jgi:hypothetical protein